MTRECVFIERSFTLTMDNTAIPSVTIIGTCRVHDTLRKVNEKGYINVNNGGMSTFVHSLPEIIQRLRVFSRDSKYSPEIVGLQVGVRKGVTTEPDKDFNFEETDLIVIEISTLKAIYYENQPLQFNEVNRLLCTPHGDFGIELRNNIDYAFKNKETSILLPSIPFPETVSENHRQIIANLKPKLMNEQDIQEYLDRIYQYVKKPILFVNHINVEGVNGRKITSRNRLCKIIQKYCTEHSFALFEPSTLFSQHDKKTLLAKDGTDLAHYARSGLEIVGMEQYGKILELFNAQNSRDSSHH